MKNNLLVDLEKAYKLIRCETEENSFCVDCDYCKNEQLCIITYNLIHSIKKFYIKR